MEGKHGVEGFDRKSRALVTGASGFMGTHMVDLLLANGYEVVATDIYGAKPYRETKARFIPADLTVAGDIHRFLAIEEPFDAVFHIAGLFDYSQPFHDLYRVNVLGALNLLEALRGEATDAPKSVVIWGAAGVYDFSHGGPVKESDPMRPSGGYLTSKWVQIHEALRFGKRHNLPVTVIMPGGVYGPRSKYGVATSIMMAARGAMGPIYMGSGKNRAGMVHVVDVCRAALFLAELSCVQPDRIDVAGQIFNVGDDSQYTVEKLTRAIAVQLGFPFIPWIRLPFGIMRTMVGNLGKKAEKLGRVSGVNEEMLALMTLDSLLDTSKLCALGWSARYPDAVQGLLETVRWYEEEGLL
ncbi:MAG: NAD(P)-dependent oxidoreductase [Patescibacteria group bacterium]